MSLAPTPRCSLLLTALFVVAASGCTLPSIPAGRRGVTALYIHGAERLDERALAVCLATREREDLAIDISTNPNPTCGISPFAASHLRLALWSWPWTDWPLFDRVIFDRDIQRIERWYRARGYYDAHVTSAVTTPADDAPPEAGNQVQIDITLTEGEPVRTESVTFEGIDALDEDLQAALHARAVEVGKRFDEEGYGDSKTRMLTDLREASYARATVEGAVEVNPATRIARVVYRIVPGESCLIGNIELHIDNPHLPPQPVITAASLDRGMRYATTTIEGAQRAIYALGSFSSVEITPDLTGTSRYINLRIDARAGTLTRLGFGVGFQYGDVLQGNSVAELETIRQWDIHALAVYENRNLFSGMRRFRAEIRPREIFRSLLDPIFGMLATTEFRQPDFFEARTNLVAGARWDWSPDPYGRTFRRHVLDAWMGPERSWWRGKFYGYLAIHGLLFYPTELQDTQIPNDQVRYQVGFFEQLIKLDLRDNALQPRNGAYFQLGLQEAVFPSNRSWQYMRITPEARAYVALPLGMVLAGRFAMGYLGIISTDLPQTVSTPDGDKLGPGALGPETYRLRGGGSNSNRGYLAGSLGGTTLFPNAPTDGGIRRWEASLELRVSLTENFGLVFFADAGDVSPLPRFRWYALQLSLGFGFRYRTIVGPVRLDFGFRVPSARVLGTHADVPPEPTDTLFGINGVQGAFHITIGESY
ncbi:MAG: BamA/TamA family outer membrane protein [Sandaracinaceae bacterium]|nr:BamA/TamA family outer membrane protein [Sandaracinaceae bacterium]